MSNGSSRRQSLPPPGSSIGSIDIARDVLFNTHKYRLIGSGVYRDAYLYDSVVYKLDKKDSPFGMNHNEYNARKGFRQKRNWRIPKMSLYQFDNEAVIASEFIKDESGVLSHPDCNSLMTQCELCWIFDWPQLERQLNIRDLGHTNVAFSAGTWYVIDLGGGNIV